MGTGSFWGVKLPGRGVEHPPGVTFTFTGSTIHLRQNRKNHGHLLQCTQFPKYTVRDFGTAKSVFGVEARESKIMWKLVCLQRL